LPWFESMGLYRADSFSCWVTQSKKFSIFYGTWSFITMTTQSFWDINTVSLVKSSLRWLDTLKHHELCTQWYSRTPQKTWIFTVRTLEFVFITMLTKSHHLTLFNAASHTTSERSILISYSCLCYVSKMVFSLQVFRVKFDINFSSPPCVLHDSCITKVCHTWRWHSTLTILHPKLLQYNRLYVIKKEPPLQQLIWE